MGMVFLWPFRVGCGNCRFAVAACGLCDSKGGMQERLETHRRTRFLGYGACALAGCLWGTGFYFGKLALREMSVGHMVLYRFLFASLGMLPVLVLPRLRRSAGRAGAPKWTGRETRTLLIAAALGIPLQFLLQFEGLA